MHTQSVSRYLRRRRRLRVDSRVGGDDVPRTLPIVLGQVKLSPCVGFKAGPWEDDAPRVDLRALVCAHGVWSDGATSKLASHACAEHT